MQKLHCYPIAAARDRTLSHVAFSSQPAAGHADIYDQFVKRGYPVAGIVKFRSSGTSLACRIRPTSVDTDKGARTTKGKQKETKVRHKDRNNTKFMKHGESPTTTVKSKSFPTKGIVC